MDYPVYISHVTEYTREAVRAGLVEALEALGGLNAFIKPGQRVLVKPNLISERFESQTNPVVVVELARLVRQFGCEVAIADSSAWHSVQVNAAGSGLLTLARDHSIPLLEFNRPVRTKIRGRSITISRHALEADAIINVPKLKAHGQIKLTAGVKNLFGCVPGKRKAFWHFRAGHNVNYFGRMLVRTYLAARPPLTIIDAIDAMEGLGPIGGTLRRIGALIASPDAFAAEYLACELIGCDPNELITIQTGRKMGLGPENAAAIHRLGTPVEILKVTDFNFPNPAPLWFSLPRVCKSVAKQFWHMYKDRSRL